MWRKIPWGTQICYTMQVITFSKLNLQNGIQSEQSTSAVSIKPFNMSQCAPTGHKRKVIAKVRWVLSSKGRSLAQHNCKMG